MKREHPLFSPIGCLGGLVLAAGLVLAVIFTGGAVFSPGDLTGLNERAAPLQGFQSHADFQNNCNACHAPFGGVTAERCQACHADIAHERAAATGLHGKLAAAQASRCQTCHTDHQGRNFNTNLAAFQKFDHASLGFSLDRHIVGYDGAALTCQTCHRGGDYTFQASTCVNCHGAHDANFTLDHAHAFGQNCVACHDGVDKTKGFDHAQTKFALDGGHSSLQCAACHRQTVAPKDTLTNCAGCHTAPASHAGAFDNQDCAACHTSAAWSPAHLANQPLFQHANAAFQLVNHTHNYDGKPMACLACHTQAAAGDFTVNTQTCISCHTSHDAAFMQQHVQQYGTNCASCHNGAGNMKNFYHSQVFALDGQHASVACAACHMDQKFKGTPRECSACHQEPAIHKGIFGTQCQACHTTTAWSPAQLTQHTFPLAHSGQGEISCQTCHTQTYTAYTCAGCHEHDPQKTRDEHANLGLADDRLAQCAACHATGHRQGNN